MQFPSGWELVLIVFVIVLLFGARKLPAAARGLGQSLRIFKTEVGSLTDDDKKDVEDKVAPPPSANGHVTPAITSATVVAPNPMVDGSTIPAPAPVIQTPIVQAPAVQVPVVPAPESRPADR